MLFLLIEQHSGGLIFPYAGYLLVIFGALRLAKFNNDTRQGEFFYGLPVPAAGIFFSGLPYLAAIENNFITSALSNQYVLIAITIVLSALMVSDFKLMSLKFSDFKIKGNWQRYLLLLSSLLLLLFWQFAALPVIISLYLVLSMALNIGD
jgi:CDP-diacylglycerol--serine O-phosphatidyltransferase